MRQQDLAYCFGWAKFCFLGNRWNGSLVFLLRNCRACEQVARPGILKRVDKLINTHFYSPTWLQIPSADRMPADVRG